MDISTASAYGAKWWFFWDGFLHDEAPGANAPGAPACRGYCPDLDSVMLITRFGVA